MGRSFDEWLNEGEELYRTTLEDVRDMENQLSALQVRLASRKTELNKLGEVLNKQPVHITSGGTVHERSNGASPTEELETAPRTPARNFLGGPLR